MRVWYIQCAVTGDMWSRNKWATPTTIPDLFMSKGRAEYSRKYNKPSRCSLHHVPVVREGYLSL